jgi:hypothetical protein
MAVEATLGVANIIDIEIGSKYQKNPLQDPRIGEAIESVIPPVEGLRGYYLSMLMDAPILRIVLPTVSRNTGDLDPRTAQIDKAVSAIVR